MTGLTWAGPSTGATTGPGPQPGTEIDAVLFDVNGTLVHIRTDDHDPEVFRAAGHFLTYQGIDLRRHQVRDLYFEAMRAQRAASPHPHPEFDAVRIWADIVAAHAGDYTRSLPAQTLEQLPRALAELTRGVARRRLKLYPHVRRMLAAIREHVPVAVVTDAQTAWARPELHAVGLLEQFEVVVVSGDHGFRKPEGRLFELALEALDVPAQRAVYVGNDVYRDVHGAQQAGMRAVLYDSDQGTKEFPGTVPDATITDHLELLDLFVPR